MFQFKLLRIETTKTCKIYSIKTDHIDRNNFNDKCIYFLLILL